MNNLLRWVRTKDFRDTVSRHLAQSATIPRASLIEICRDAIDETSPELENYRCISEKYCVSSEDDLRTLKKEIGWRKFFNKRFIIAKKLKHGGLRGQHIEGFYLYV